VIFPEFFLRPPCILKIKLAVLILPGNINSASSHGVWGRFEFDTEEAMVVETRSEEFAFHTRPAVPRSAHQLETDVRSALNAADGLDIGSLVVRRLPNGICLEGVIRVSSDDFDVCRAVREIEGVGEVVNHLVVCWNCPMPASGVHDEMFL
jgi:hypothetical protein